MKDRYIFPAVITADDDGMALEFPDLPGCVTCGQDMADLYESAREALGLHLYGMEEENEPIPPASDSIRLTSELAQGQFVMMVEVWMPTIRRAAEQKSVKKTLTIPKWLNDLAESQKVNFSQVLQDALKEHLGVSFRQRPAQEVVDETSATSETPAEISLSNQADIQSFREVNRGDEAFCLVRSPIVHGSWGTGKSHLLKWFLCHSYQTVSFNSRYPAHTPIWETHLLEKAIPVTIFVSTVWQDFDTWQRLFSYDLENRWERLSEVSRIEKIGDTKNDSLDQPAGLGSRLHRGTAVR